MESIPVMIKAYFDTSTISLSMTPTLGSIEKTTTRLIGSGTMILESFACLHAACNS